MTPRERWLALFDGRKPDRHVTDYWATNEFHAKLRQAVCITGDSDKPLLEKLGIDRPFHLGPTWKYKHHPDDPLANEWGIRFAEVDYGTGSYGEAVHFPLAKCDSTADVHAFHWPSPDDYDYSGIAEKLRQNNGYRIVKGGSYEPFLLYCWMRGMEQAFEDMLVNPEIITAALGYIFDFHYELNRRIWQAGKIDMMYLAEDLGGQTGPLISLEAYRRFLLPNQKKVAALARSFGIRVFYHTDGAARMFLPDLVNEVGIDILNPLQWRCPGMDLSGLVRDYGDRLIFHGGIDNQQTLPFGTVEDVRKEVREVAAVMRDSRWICAPCHNIQSVSPAANVIAMYETIREILV
ncbi:MAG: uroporphyrinogen decarboxylase family protein [Verrucomicrobiota bacterium]|jgi:uroporphyrinogen decarboxylase